MQGGWLGVWECRRQGKLAVLALVRIGRVATLAELSTQREDAAGAVGEEAWQV